MVTTFTFKAEGIRPNTIENSTISIEPFPQHPQDILGGIKSNQQEAQRLGKWMKDFLTGEACSIVTRELAK